MQALKNYIAGQWVESAGALKDVYNPSNGELIGQVPLSPQSEMDAAIDAAQEAFCSWRLTPVSVRVSYLFKFYQLLQEDLPEISRLISIEGGKNKADSDAEIKRMMQNVECACGAPMLLAGEKLMDIASGGMDGEVIRQPLGVFGIIAPFNFPGMVPFWFMPYALAAGDTLVIKPSEQVPLTMQRIFTLIDKLGLPAGVINMVNGDKDTAAPLLENPKVKGVSFVGNTATAKKIAMACAANNKRFQALGSAKNHTIVMPDADLDRVVKALLTSCFGCAGQRCMATSLVVAMPEVYDELVAKFVEAAKGVVAGDALSPDTDMGPVISAAAKERILGLIEKGIADGAELLLDGRNLQLPAPLDKGHFVGATIFGNVTKDMAIYQEEIFGPVVGVMKAANLDEALALIRDCRFGNGASIFTQNGYWARQFQQNASAGMLGINVGIPAPVAYFPFGGEKESIYGDVKAQGRDVFDFMTQRKVVTTRFFAED